MPRAVRLYRRPMLRLLEPWRTRVLWASLGLNLFAIAMVGAPHLWRPHSSGPPNFESLIDRLARPLPPDDQMRFRAAMTREQPWYELGRRDLQAKRDALADAITRDPFDPAAVRAAFAELQDELRRASTRFDESLILALGELTPAGRAELADRLRHHRP